MTHLRRRPFVVVVGGRGALVFELRRLCDGWVDLVLAIDDTSSVDSDAALAEIIIRSPLAIPTKPELRADSSYESSPHPTPSTSALDAPAIGSPMPRVELTWEDTSPPARMSVFSDYRFTLSSLSEERRSGREYARTEFEWRRTPTGFVRVGERVTEDVVEDGKRVRVTSTIRHRAIRIQPE